MSHCRVFVQHGCLWALALAGCFSLIAQDDAGLQARQLYYKPKDDTATNPPAKKTTSHQTTTHQTTKSTQTTKPANDKPADNPLGLKFTIVQDDGTGKLVEVDPTKEFATGDSIRLQMEVNADAYVYLLSRGSSGSMNFLFPEAAEDNRLKPFRSVQVPAAGEPIHFADPSGTEILYILASKKPIDDLQRLIPAHGPSGGSTEKLMAANVPNEQFTEIMGRANLQSRDLVRGTVHPIETSSGNGDVREHAVYVVNVSDTPGAQVVQKIELKHK